jgi:hypothetical protein
MAGSSEGFEQIGEQAEVLRGGHVDDDAARQFQLERHVRPAATELGENELLAVFVPTGVRTTCSLALDTQETNVGYLTPQ